MEDGQKVYSHTMLGVAWFINSISPSGIGITLAGMASIAALLSYIQQVVIRKKQLKMDQEQAERNKILFDKQMKQFDEKDKINKN